MSGTNCSPPADAAPEPARDELLAMTVHSLPVPDAGRVERQTATRGGRLKLLLILLVCAAPVIASYFTYYVIRPEGRRSYGTLIEPQRPLPAVAGVDLQGRERSLATLRDQWLLLSVADSSCAPPCERHLYLQRQLRQAMGRDKGRLDWVWLHSGSADLPEALRPALEEAVVLRVDRQVLDAWLPPAEGQRVEDHLYVVDPLGHLMMRFPAEADPALVRRDLSRLLTASRFWDKEGRE